MLETVYDDEGNGKYWHCPIHDIDVWFYDDVDLHRKCGEKMNPNDLEIEEYASPAKGWTAKVTHKPTGLTGEASHLSLNKAKSDAIEALERALDAWENEGGR